MGVMATPHEAPVSGFCSGTKPDPLAPSASEAGYHQDSDRPAKHPGWALERDRRLCVKANYRALQRYNDFSVVDQAMGAADRS